MHYRTANKWLELVNRAGSALDELSEDYLRHAKRGEVSPEVSDRLLSLLQGLEELKKVIRSQAG